MRFYKTKPKKRTSAPRIGHHTPWNHDPKLEVFRVTQKIKAQTMIKFNKEVSEYPGMSTVIVPFRDGVLVGLKEYR